MAAEQDKIDDLVKALTSQDDTAIPMEQLLTQLSEFLPEDEKKKLLEIVDAFSSNLRSTS